MSIFTDFHELTKHGVNVGQTITVHTAHKYENGYWSAWSQADYHISILYFDKITMYNVKHRSEGLYLTPKNMKSGQFKVELPGV